MAYAAWSVSFGEQPSAAKWNILGTNDAYFDSLIGSGTAWTSYTPTWSGLTVGNATQSSAWMQLGKTVFVRIGLTYGSTTSFPGGEVLFSLPVTSTTYTTLATLGTSGIYDLSATTPWAGSCTWRSTTTVRVGSFSVSGSNIFSNNLSSTVPITFATGDVITAEINYQAA